MFKCASVISDVRGSAILWTYFWRVWSGARPIMHCQPQQQQKSVNFLDDQLDSGERARHEENRNTYIICVHMLGR